MTSWNDLYCMVTVIFSIFFGLISLLLAIPYIVFMVQCLCYTQPCNERKFSIALFVVFFSKDIIIDMRLSCLIIGPFLN